MKRPFKQELKPKKVLLFDYVYIITLKHGLYIYVYIYIYGPKEEASQATIKAKKILKFVNLCILLHKNACIEYVYLYK